MGFEPVFQLLAMLGENQCSTQNPRMNSCAESSGGNSEPLGGLGQREVRTRMLGDVCRKSVSPAGSGRGGVWAEESHQE